MSQTLSEEENIQCDILAQNFLESVIKEEGKSFSLDILQSLLEKKFSATKAGGCGLDSNSSGKNGSAAAPETVANCPHCYLPRELGHHMTELLPGCRTLRSIRYPMTKQQTVLHSLTNRDKLMLASYDQWANISKTRCLVCGHSIRRLCPMPGKRRPPPSKTDKQKKTLPSSPPATLVKQKRKRPKSIRGFALSQESLKELAMSRNKEINKKNKETDKGDISLNLNPGADGNGSLKTRISSVNTTSITESPRKKKFVSSEVDTTKTLSSKQDTQKKIESTPNSKDNSGASQNIVKLKTEHEAPRNLKSESTPKSKNKNNSKGNSTTGVKEPINSPMTSLKFNNSNNQCSISVTTSVNNKVQRSQSVSTAKNSNYPMPLIRGNQSTKKMNSAKANALKNAIQRSATLKYSRGGTLKDFLNTLF